MSGLVLKLAAGERVVVNGAVLENGDKPARVRIADSNVRVLRCRDALRPEDVDTPVKQVYFGVQLLITGDLDEARALPAIDAECCKLQDVFELIDPKLVPLLRTMVERGNYYSALCHLRQMMVIEDELLRHASTSSSPVLQAAV
jgi:flagellar protein FlbT